MPTTSIKKSGNRGSGNNQESGAPTAEAAAQTATAPTLKPQQSQTPFTFPGYPAIKEMPSIKNLVGRGGEHVTSSANTQPAEVAAPSVESPAQEVPAEPAPPVVEAVTPEETEEPAKEESLEGNWNEVVDALFTNLPILYYTLKKTVPAFENGVLTVEVSNNIQEEELEQRKRAVLEYWRTHFKMDLDDFEIVLNENKVTETAILTSDEQFQRMKEQNPELLEFLDVLKFRMKY